MAEVVGKNRWRLAVGEVVVVSEGGPGKGSGG